MPQPENLMKPALDRLESLAKYLESDDRPNLARVARTAAAEVAHAETVLVQQLQEARETVKRQADEIRELRGKAGA